RRRTGVCELVPPARTFLCSTLGLSAVHAGSSDLTGACAGCCSTGSGCQPLLCRSSSRKACKKCGQFRTAETGHSQYKGIIYCPSVEAVPKEQWLEDIKTCMKNKLINCPPLPEAW